MGIDNIRPAYNMWPQYNRRLRDVVAAVTDEQLAIRPSAARWPLWATVGHTACQRVSWLCGFAGEPGADETPFPETVTGVGWEDEESTPRAAGELVTALESTFRIVESCLDRWTVDMLGEELRRTFGDQEWVYSRGSVIQRVFAHDVYHCAELNETLGIASLPQINLWD